MSSKAFILADSETFAFRRYPRSSLASASWSVAYGLARTSSILYHQGPRRSSRTCPGDLLPMLQNFGIARTR
jgi:hypothetical protein